MNECSINELFECAKLGIQDAYIDWLLDAGPLPDSDDTISKIGIIIEQLAGVELDLQETVVKAAGSREAAELMLTGPESMSNWADKSDAYKEACRKLKEALVESCSVS